MQFNSSFDYKLLFTGASGSGTTNTVLDIPGFYNLDGTNATYIDTLVLARTPISVIDSNSEIKTINTIFNFNCGSDASELTININDGGSIIFNIDVSLTTHDIYYSDSTNKKQKKLNLNYNGGNIVLNTMFNLNPNLSEPLIINANIYNLKSLMINYNINSKPLIINKYFYNYGNLNQSITKPQNIYFGFSYDSSTGEYKESTQSRINNFGNMRLYNIKLNGHFSNAGLLKINGRMDILDSNLAMNITSKLIIMEGGKLKFILNKPFNDNLIYHQGDYINVQEKSSIEIELNKSSSSQKFLETPRIIVNLSTVKNDGTIKLIDPFNNEEAIIKNEIGIVYLENDFKIEGNIKFLNNDVILSVLKDPIFIQNEVEDETYLNISTLTYLKNGNKKILKTDNEIKDLIFELNSSDIEPDVLNTIIYLLTKQYEETYGLQTKDILDEILKLIKFGLLKDWHYTPNIPIQPIQPPHPLPPSRSSYLCKKI